MDGMVQIGRVDIVTKISRQIGHLLTALHVIGYTKLKRNTRLVFVPSFLWLWPVILSMFPDRTGQSEMYSDIEEGISNPRQDAWASQIGGRQDAHMSIVSDHSGKKQTCCCSQREFFFISIWPALIWHPNDSSPQSSRPITTMFPASTFRSLFIKRPSLL